MNQHMKNTRLERNHARTQKAQFDAMSPKGAADQLESDAISEREAITVTSQMRIKALYIVFMLSAILSESDYDDDEMLPSEALDNLMIESFVDDDDDDDDGGDIDEYVRATLSAHVSDAFSTLGVEDSIVQDLFGDDVEIADAAALAAAETVLENMPDDGSDFDDFVSTFAYTDDMDVADSEEDAAAFDSLAEPEYQFDAAGKKLRVGKKTIKKVNGRTLTYRAVKAIRNGKKVVINKRILGKPILKSSQKAALRKARMKAGTASALRKQMKSFGKGLRMNIYKGNPNRLKALKNAGYARHTKANFGGK